MEKEFKISLLKHIIKVNISSSKTLKMETENSNSKISAPASAPTPENNPPISQDPNEILFMTLRKYRSVMYSAHDHLYCELHREWLHRKKTSGKSYLSEDEKMSLWECLKWLRRNYPKIEA